MTKNLFSNYLRIFLILFLTTSNIVYSQIDLVKYSFTGNLNADAIPVPPANTVLEFKGSNNVTKSPNLVGNQLSTTSEGDFLELSIDTSDKEGLALSFDAEFTAFFITGSWTVQTNTGTNGSFEDIDRINMYSIFNYPLSNGNSIIALPTEAGNKSDLKIRIKTSFTAIGGTISIDNLRLTYGLPNITVYKFSNTNTASDILQSNVDPSIVNTTDFGTMNVGNSTAIRYFRIRNYNGTGGTNPLLRMNRIVVVGDNPDDFVLSGVNVAALVNVNSHNGTSFRQFGIQFTPKSDGIRTAEIHIYSNAVPSPYIIKVIGLGASCKLEPTTFAINNFTPNSGSLASSHVVADLINGTSSPANLNSLRTILYPNNTPLYSSANFAIFQNGSTDKTFNFGGSNGLNVSGQKEVAIEFKVAAFGTNDSNNNSLGSGVNSNSTISLEVANSSGVFSEELKLIGNSSTARTRYSFAQGASTLLGTFDGDNSPTQQSNSNNTKYGTFRLLIPASAALDILKFKIIVNAGKANTYWIIDDVKVLTSNAVFKTWNGSSWSPSAPTSNEKALVNGTLQVPSNISYNWCECEIGTIGSLTINNNAVVNLKGKMLVNGIFTIKDGGNLVQVEDEAENMGNANVEKVFNFVNNILIPSKDRQQYNYVSSPVVGQNIKQIYPGNPIVTTLRETKNLFYSDNGSYVVGKGYGIKEPSKTAVPTNNVIAKYVGVPFNGKVEFDLAYTTSLGAEAGRNLVGNPYPSKLDLQKLYDANKTKITRTFAFWDNRNNTVYTQQGTGYSGQNYAYYNAFNDTGNPASASAAGTASGAGVKIPTKDVSVGTGFLVRAIAPNEKLVFNNSMRSTTVSTNFTGKNVNNSNAEEEVDRFWLTVKSPGNLLYTTAVVYFENGNTAFGIDDTEVTNTSSDDIYTFSDDVLTRINGRPNFDVADKVKIGFRSFKSGQYTINLSEVQGVFSTKQDVYLKDINTGIISNLSNGDYTFYSDKGEFNNRFELSYQTEDVLFVAKKNKEDLKVYRDGEDFVVKSDSKNISSVDVYDMSGRLVKTMVSNAKIININFNALHSGIYILKILRNDEIIIKKVKK